MSKISNIAFCLLFIITVCLSVGFWLFLGKEANKENILAFKSYLEKEGVEVVWSDKDDKLTIKHNNIELNQINDFKLIKSLSYLPTENQSMKFSFEGVDDIQNKLLFGDPLKNEFTEIKVIVNNLDNEETVTHKELGLIYEKYYPYKITLCDMDSYIYLNNQETVCPDSNHINLVVDTVSKSYTMKINYYKEWGGIVARYLTYSTAGMENKLADFKAASTNIKEKFGDDLEKLKITKIDGNKISVNGDIKKTIRPLDTEFLAIIDDKKDYIERDVGEVYYYVAFTKNNAVDDFNYIISQLQNKVAAKTKQMKDIQLKHNDPVTDQSIEQDKKIPDKTVKPLEEQKSEKEINNIEIQKTIPETSKPIETTPLTASKKLVEEDKKEAVKDIIKEKVKKVESDSKTIVELKPIEKGTNQQAPSKP